MDKKYPGLRRFPYRLHLESPFTKRLFPTHISLCIDIDCWCARGSWVNLYVDRRTDLSLSTRPVLPASPRINICFTVSRREAHFPLCMTSFVTRGRIGVKWGFSHSHKIWERRGGFFSLIFRLVMKNIKPWRLCSLVILFPFHILTETSLDVSNH